MLPNILWAQPTTASALKEGHPAAVDSYVEGTRSASGSRQEL